MGPGLVLLLFAQVIEQAASLLALALFLVTAPPIPAFVSSLVARIREAANAVGAGWVALALLVSFVSVKLSIRLAP